MEPISCEDNQNPRDHLGDRDANERTFPADFIGNLLNEFHSQKFDSKQNFLIGLTHPKINEPRKGKRALIGKCFKRLSWD